MFCKNSAVSIASYCGYKGEREGERLQNTGNKMHGGEIGDRACCADSVGSWTEIDDNRDEVHANSTDVAHRVEKFRAFHVSSTHPSVASYWSA